MKFCSIDIARFERMNKLLKLILTDLDGTFLNSQGTYNRDYFLKLWSKLKENQIAFGVCTGKSSARVETLFPEISDKIWILADSATRIKYQGKFLYEQLLDNQIALALISRLQAIHSDQIIIAYTKNAVYIDQNIPKIHKNRVLASYPGAIEINDFQQITDDFIKVTVYDPASRCLETVQQLADFTECAYIVASETQWIDIAAKGVHKGSTVAKLQELLKISPEETAAFGDGWNDLELFAQANFRFAMKNAVEALKNQANFIIPSNDEEGVLQTIELLLSLMEKKEGNTNEN